MKPEIKTVFVGDIAFNTDITPNKQQTSIGGAAYYCAVGAIAAHTREGVKQRNIGIVAPVGGDFDLHFLIEKDLNIEGVSIIPDGKTCQFVLTQHPDNTRDFKAERGVAEKIDTSRFPLSYATAEYVHLATSLPQNYLVWMKYLEGMTKAKISADAFETFARQFPHVTIEALNKADIIFLNDEEANILAKKGSLRTDVPWVLKHGSAGASYLIQSKEIKVSAPKSKTVETTGAGDTLAGAFLSLLAQGYEIEHALTIAVTIASHSITQFGVEHLAKKP